MTCVEAAIECKLVTLQPPDLVLQAWRHSRPNDDGATLERVFAVDLPVNEMAQIQVQLFCPILLREYVVTARNHCVWARTSRVDDLTVWPVFCVTPAIQALKKHFDANVGEIYQDQSRLDLPLGYMTHFTASFSMRDYVNLIRAMDAEVIRSSENLITSDMFRAMRDALMSVLPDEWIPAVVTSRSFKAIVGEATDWGGNYSERSGEFVIASLQMPLALRAQVARARKILITDNLRTFFCDDALGWPISTIMHAELAMSVETAKQLCAQRNCWIAQEGLWAELLALLRKKLPSGGNALPCDDTGVCPFERDNRLRLAGRDPAPPCPRFARLMNEPLGHVDRERVKDYSLTRSDGDFWRKELEHENA